MIMTYDNFGDTPNNDAATSGKPMHHYVEAMILDMECSADWRRQKAEEYPEDKVRNLDCAAEFDEMAKRLSEYEGGPALIEYEAVFEAFGGGCALCEFQTEATRSIYFTASDPEEFFRDLVESYESMRAVS